MTKNYLRMVEINNILTFMNSEGLDYDDREIIKTCMIYEDCYGNPHDFVDENGAVKEGKMLSDIYAIYEDIIANTDFFEEKKNIKNIETLENLIEVKFGVVGLIKSFLDQMQGKIEGLEKSLKNGDLMAQLKEITDATNKE